MGKSFKTGDTITLYFGDTMRELLSKPLRKKEVYFVDCEVVSAEDDTITVLSKMKNAKDIPPYKVMGLCLKKDDNHILPKGTLGKLRDIDKEELAKFASSHGFNVKELKIALKPFRKDGKKD